MKNNIQNNGKINDVATRDTYASLYFRNKDLNPDLVTELLGIEPLKKFKKGESYGMQKEKFRRTGFWYVSTNEYIQSENIEDHLVWLLEKIELVNKDFMEMVAKEKHEVEITCVLQVFSVEDGFTITPIILKRIADLNFRFGISVYCFGGSSN